MCQAAGRGRPGGGFGTWGGLWQIIRFRELPFPPTLPVEAKFQAEVRTRRDVQGPGPSQTFTAGMTQLGGAKPGVQVADAEQNESFPLRKQCSFGLLSLHTHDYILQNIT